MAKKVETEKVDKPITWKDIKSLLKKYNNDEMDFAILANNSAAWLGIIDNLVSLGFRHVRQFNNPSFERHPYIIVRSYDMEFFAYTNHYSGDNKVFSSTEIWWLT